MKMDSVKLTLVTVVIIFCMGCGSKNSVFSGISSFFFPKKIDLQKDSGLSKAEKRLSKLFAVSEEKLHSLLRELNTFEEDDSQNKGDYFYNEFEWVQWVAVTDLQGKIENRYPSNSNQKIAIQSLQESVQAKFPRKIQYRLTPKGSKSDICIFKPLFKGYSLDGYIIVGVDVDSLLQNNSNPEELVVLTPEKVLWSGKYSASKAEMLKQDWETKLQNAVKGKMLIDNRKFFWFARYIGIDPMVYVLKNP